MPRKKQPRNIARARQQRQSMSLPEVLLWRELKQQHEVKFRRQHSIEPYFLDFYCAKAKVCIEVDGIAHGMSGRPARDIDRDERLRVEGIETVRIPATDVLADPHAVAERLIRYCQR